MHAKLCYPKLCYKYICGIINLHRIPFINRLIPRLIRILPPPRPANILHKLRPRRPRHVPNSRITHRTRMLQHPEAEIQRLRAIAGIRRETHVVADRVRDFLLDVADHDEGLVVGETVVADGRRVDIEALEPGIFSRGAAGDGGDFAAAVLAGFKEVDTLITEGGGHGGEGLVEDDDVWSMDDGTEEEDDALLGGVELSESDRVGVFHVVVGWNVGLVASKDFREQVLGRGRDPGRVFLGGDRGVGVELCFEEAQGCAYVEVSLVVQFRFGEEGLGKGGLDRLTDAQLTREEGMDLGGGVTHAGLKLEKRNGWFAGFGKSRASE